MKLTREEANRRLREGDPDVKAARREGTLELVDELLEEDEPRKGTARGPRKADDR